MRIFARLGGGLLVWVWMLATLGVFAWLVFGSFKTNQSIFQDLWGLPTSLNLDNYVAAWNVTRLGRHTINSIIVVGSATLITVALSALAAYALSRIKFRGAVGLLTFFAVGIGIPVHMLLIPLFVMLARMQLVNTLAGLTIAYVATSLPFTVFLLTGFFRSLPSELEEAAAMDGARPFTTFRRVMLPLARPGLITAAILNAVLMWNEYLLALVLMTDNRNFTLSLGLLNMYGSMRYTSNWAGLFAGVVIVVLPMALFYLWLSGRIIEGLTLGTGK